MTVLFALLLVGSVDRIEGAYAVVEWADGHTTDVALHLVPCAREGDRVRLRLRRHVQPGAVIRVTSSARRQTCTSKTRTRPSRAL